MERKSIEEIIIQDAKKKVLDIENETKEIIKKMQKDSMEKNKQVYRDKVSQALIESEMSIKATEKQLNNELISYERLMKQNLISDLFKGILAKVNTLENEELLKWITKLLSELEIQGNETMIVSDLKYEVYLKALSSSKNSEHLDKLNHVSHKFQFKLEKGMLDFQDGFMLIGDTYDLIFNFQEIIDTYQKQKEYKLFKELFDNV